MNAMPAAGAARFGWVRLWVLLLLSGLAHGHPLGNNTVNRQAVLTITRAHVALRYVLDLAEIPTLLAAQSADGDGDGDGVTAATEWNAYARRRGDEIRAGILLSASGRALAPSLVATRWQRLPGAAGLDTLHLQFDLVAPLHAYTSARIDYRDQRLPDEAGWKEVVAVSGRGARLLQADVPARSPSRNLTAYPEAGLNIPNVLAAQVEVAAPPLAREPQTSVAAPAAPMPARPAAALTAAPPVAPAAAPVAGVAAFFRLGVHHIALGLDHLVFLLGLMATQNSLRRLVWVVTAFTVAHSLTLGLAAGGIVALPGLWVESAIGLTIVYVGIANLRGGLRHGAAIAFAFGLVHGLGFAGALAASLAGSQIGGSDWLLDLALFNLGVEAGQFAFVLSLLLLVAAVRNLKAEWPRQMRAMPGAVVGLLGMYWTVQPALALSGVVR